MRAVAAWERVCAAIPTASNGVSIRAVRIPTGVDIVFTVPGSPMRPILRISYAKQRMESYWHFGGQHVVEHDGRCRGAIADMQAASEACAELVRLNPWLPGVAPRGLRSA